jgi:hypothetical protein
MASFYAELEVAGNTYPVRSCQFEFAQATGGRGRATAKVRHGTVQLSLDVPDSDFLLNWGATAYKPLAGHVTFFEADRRTARETLLWEAGNCVSYHENFAAGDSQGGAYVCHLTIAAPKLALQPGGPPRPLVAATSRDYATALPPALAASIKTAQATPMLSKQQRYDARMSLLGNARAKLADTKMPAANPLAAAADATQVAPSAGATRLASERQRLQAATDRLARNNVAVERARLADDSYENEVAIGPGGQRTIVRKSPLPEGWKVNRVTEDKHSGFMAVEYESSFERPPRKVLAFRGTDPSQAGDRETDLKQGLGLFTDQYQQTMDVAKRMKRLNPGGFDITGHSLGGGEASLAGLITGQPTYTFNAAGLHVESMLRAGIDPKDLARQRVIQAYYSDRDPLSWPQDHPLIAKTVLKGVIPFPLDKLVGPIIDNPNNMPAAIGTRRPFHDAGLHPVVPLVGRIEEQKDEDTATIRQLTAPSQ